MALISLRSTAVQYMIQESQKTGHLVAHFFYNHSSKTRLKAAHLFQSYIKQILGYLDIIRKPCPSQIVSFVKRFFGLKRSCPNFEAIVHKIFLPLSKLLPHIT